MAYLRPLVGVSAADFADLEAGSVNCTVVKAFFRLIDRRSVFYPTLPKSWSMDPRLLVHFSRDPVNGPRQYAGGRGLLEKELVLFPIQQLSWSLIAVRPRRREVLAFDPFATPRAVEMETILDFLEAVAVMEGRPFARDDWVTKETPEGCPRAPEGNAGGEFVCVFGDKLSRDAGLFGLNIGLKEARRTIHGVLLDGRFGREDFSQIHVSIASMESPPLLEEPNEPPLPNQDPQDDMELDEEINSRLATVQIAGPSLPSCPQLRDETGFVPQVAGATVRDPLGLGRPPNSPILTLDCSDVEIHVSPRPEPPVPAEPLGPQGSNLRRTEGHREPSSRPRNSRRRNDRRNNRCNQAVRVQPPSRVVDQRSQTRPGVLQPTRRVVRVQPPPRLVDPEPPARAAPSSLRQGGEQQPRREDRYRHYRSRDRRERRPTAEARGGDRQDRRRPDVTRECPEPRSEILQILRQAPPEATPRRVSSSRRIPDPVRHQDRRPQRTGRDERRRSPRRADVVAYITRNQLPITNAIVRRVTQNPQPSGPNPQRNTRWRVFVGPGEFVRVRPNQVRQLLAVRRQQSRN